MKTRNEHGVKQGIFPFAETPREWAAARSIEHLEGLTGLAEVLGLEIGYDCGFTTPAGKKDGGKEVLQRYQRRQRRHK